MLGSRSADKIEAPVQITTRKPASPRSTLRTISGLLALTTVALAVHGYHLGVEDAAIYLPAIKKT